MLADGTAAELYRRGGGWISLSAAPRLAWVRRHEPGVWAAATRLSMIADWMVFRLTGALATEASIGSTSGLFDLGRRAWSPELLIRCGLEPALFPEVVEAGTVVGQVSGGASSQTGLAPGTPVVAGGLDTALGLAGPRAGGTRPAHGHRRELLEADRGGARARRGTGRPPAHDLPCPAGPVAGRGDRLLRRLGAPLAPGPRRRGPASGPHGRLRRAGGTGRGGPARGGRADCPAGPGRCLDLGALAGAVPAPAGCRPGRPGRAGAGHPGGRRLLHPPRGRAAQRAARSRRMAGGQS